METDGRSLGSVLKFTDNSFKAYRKTRQINGKKRVKDGKVYNTREYLLTR